MTPFYGKRPRIAVIGAGHLGGIHSRLLAAGGLFDFAAVVDPDVKAREETAGQFGVAAYPHHRDLLGKIDAAILAAPTLWHYSIGIELLQNDIHLFVEKPLTTTAVQADVMLAAARKRELVLQVGHVERFNPAWLAAAPLIKAPLLFRCVRCGGYTGRSTDIGVTHDLMIHDLDLVLAATDASVERIEAAGSRVIGPHEDTAEARVLLSNGVVASFFASRVHTSSCRQMEIHQSRGYLSIDFTAPSVELIVGGQFQDINGQRDAAGQQASINESGASLATTRVPTESRNAIADEQYEFFTSIVVHGEPNVDGVQGRNAVALAEQISSQICWNLEGSHRLHKKAG